MARRPAPRLVVAGLSVRAQAEAAQRDGYEVVALDCFGDADTRAASVAWAPIGRPGGEGIERGRLLAALQGAVQAAASVGRECLGWWPGAGFEDQADTLAAGAAVLPLLGSPPQAVAAVNDPAQFMARLQAWGMPHPEVRWRRPPSPEGWLLRGAGGCGGQRIRPARADDPDPPPPGHCWQRRARGLPMSMTVVAAGAAGVALVGFNQQWPAPLPTVPFRFSGVAGPVPLPGRCPTALLGMAARLSADFDLRGVVGLDFLWHGDELQLLELNARWPASAALYAEAGGLVDAHLAACLHGQLPGPALQARWQGLPLSGLQYVFAPAPWPLRPSHLMQLAGEPGLHDRPALPQGVPAGAPLCTLSGRAASVAALRHEFDERTRRLWRHLENLA